MENETLSLYETWARLSDNKEALHRKLTQEGLWGIDEARQSYLDISRSSERAWVAYSASRRGVSQAQVSRELNSAMSSRLD